MRTKLVRDKCNAVLAGECERAQTEAEYQMALLLKLHEEAQEVAGDPTDLAEYADLLEVLLTLADHNGISLFNIIEECEAKREQFGGFVEGMIWTEVMV